MRRVFHATGSLLPGETMLGLLNAALFAVIEELKPCVRGVGLACRKERIMTRLDWVDSNDDKLYSSSTIGRETVWRLFISSLSEESQTHAVCFVSSEENMYIVYKIGIDSPWKFNDRTRNSLGRYIFNSDFVLCALNLPDPEDNQNTKGYCLYTTYEGGAWLKVAHTNVSET